MPSFTTILQYSRKGKTVDGRMFSRQRGWGSEEITHGKSPKKYLYQISYKLNNIKYGKKGTKMVGTIKRSRWVGR